MNGLLVFGCSQEKRFNQEFIPKLRKNTYQRKDKLQLLFIGVLKLEVDKWLQFTSGDLITEDDSK